MPQSANAMTPQMAQRVAILTQLKAQGQQLDPQHEQEYENYVRMGLAKTAGPKPIDPSEVGDYHATMATIYKAAKQNNDWETQGAIGGLLNMIPWVNNESKDYRANLQQLRDHLSIQNLQRMRESSPTGGALGNVTEGEERLLANATANLDPGQGPEQRSTNIRTVQNHFGSYLGRIGVTVPPPQAVDYLNAHPDLANEFDAKYGKGVSQYYLDAK